MEYIDGLGWRKSSFSGNGGECVEVGTVPGRVVVRDTKDRDGGRLAFGRQAWEAFAARVKADAR